MLTPYTPCPCEQRNGCSDVDDANEAGDKGCDIERSYTVSENTEALEKGSVSRE
jgi:hypothetical protein